MSQGHGGRGPPQRPGWSPLNFRSPSPYAPSPPPRLGSPSANMFNNRVPYGMACPRPRWPGPAMSPTPQGPKPFKRPMHPPSPAPNRCASPLPDSYFQGIQPYSSRTYSPVPYSPISYSSAEVGPPSRDYELVGMPMTPPPLPRNYALDEDDDSGPSTAEIIANQSQDYIDEKLAEYQATIYQLQGKRKTRTNSGNGPGSKRN